MNSFINSLACDPLNNHRKFIYCQSKKKDKIMSKETASQYHTLIQGISERFTNFKIGKTGLSLEDRLQDYGDEFKRITEVCNSTNRSKIDELEKDLIEFAKKFRNNENDQGGGGAMTKSFCYRVYIVWNP